MLNKVHSGLCHWSIYHHMAPKVPNATFLSFAFSISLSCFPKSNTQPNASSSPSVYSSSNLTQTPLLITCTVLGSNALLIKPHSFSSSSSTFSITKYHTVPFYIIHQVIICLYKTSLILYIYI